MNFIKIVYDNEREYNLNATNGIFTIKNNFEFHPVYGVKFNLLYYIKKYILKYNTSSTKEAIFYNTGNLINLIAEIINDNCFIEEIADIDQTIKDIKSLLLAFIQYNNDKLILNYNNYGFNTILYNNIFPSGGIEYTNNSPSYFSHRPNYKLMEKGFNYPFQGDKYTKFYGLINGVVVYLLCFEKSNNFKVKKKLLEEGCIDNDDLILVVDNKWYEFESSKKDIQIYFPGINIKCVDNLHYNYLETRNGENIYRNEESFYLHKFKTIKQKNYDNKLIVKSLQNKIKEIDSVKEKISKSMFDIIRDEDIIPRASLLERITKFKYYNLKFDEDFLSVLLKTKEIIQ